MAKPLVAYFRVSTARQGVSGLGLDAQRAAVHAYAAQTGASLLTEFTEVESGKRADRPKLAEALGACRDHGATLVIAKLDRLSRNVQFLSTLMNGSVPFVALDMPAASRLSLHIMAAVAEAEARAISERTIAALVIARQRGTKLGAPNPAANLSDAGRRRSLESRRRAARERFAVPMALATAWRRDGKSLAQIAREFDGLKLAFSRNGNSRWTAAAVHRVLGYATRSAATKDVVALG
jgi:DNA invertase Pin-like site-specific DNA recombinase